MQASTMVLVVRARGRWIFLLAALFFGIVIDQKRYNRKGKPCTGFLGALVLS